MAVTHVIYRSVVYLETFWSFRHSGGIFRSIKADDVKRTVEFVDGPNEKRRHRKRVLYSRLHVSERRAEWP
jgi:hypothetical protein